MLLLLFACSDPVDPARLAQGCAAGIAPDCAALGAEKSSRPALELGCAGGSLPACDALLAGGSDQPARFVGVRATVDGTPVSALTRRAREASDPLRAYADWEAACFQRDADACAQALAAYRAGVTGGYEGARAEGLARLACSYGRDDLCPDGTVPPTVGRPVVDLAPALAHAQSLCEGGWGYACRVVAGAVLAGTRDRGQLTHDTTWQRSLDDARVATERACTAGDAYACSLAPGFSCGTDDPVGCLLGG